jgi:hypothetical protein
MNKNIRLLLGASSTAALAIFCLQGCGSDSDTNTPKAGASSTAGASNAGASTGGAGSGGATAGSPSTGGGGASAGAATGGAGGSTAGAGGASGGAGGASGASAGAGGGSAGGGTELTCLSNTPFPGMGESCTSFCNNYDTTCKANVTGWTNDKYADKAACMTDCTNKFGYTGDDVQAAICCRGYHVKNAAGSDENKKTHCPHAAGKALCK